eukprot:scaffold27275_cov47-Cyclotella_meneghiniana.AAC.2
MSNFAIILSHLTPSVRSDTASPDSINTSTFSNEVPTRFDEPVDYICISSEEETFLIRAKKRPDDFSKFRLTGKVHKDPLKMRPIVACCYSFMNDWSKQWLDYWFQQLKHLIPSYVKDSQQVLDELKALVLPPNA